VKFHPLQTHALPPLHAEMGDAHRGYAFFADLLSNDPDKALHFSDASGRRYRFKFDYTRSVLCRPVLCLGRAGLDFRPWMEHCTLHVIHVMFQT